YSWNTLSSTNGNHTLLARRYDTNGTAMLSAPFTVVVNNAGTTPTVSISAPTPASGTVVATAQATALQLAHVDLFIDGIQKASCTSRPAYYTWATLSSANGNHPLLARRYDTNGTAIPSAPFTAVVSNVASSDVTPPTVTLSAPGTASGTVTLSTT